MTRQNCRRRQNPKRRVRERQGLLVTAEEQQFADLKERWAQMAAERQDHVKRVGRIGWQRERDRRRLDRLLASRYSNITRTLVVSDERNAA